MFISSPSALVPAVGGVEVDPVSAVGLEVDQYGGQSSRQQVDLMSIDIEGQR